MNLNDVLRTEIQRLHAHEVDVPPTLVRIGDRALGYGVRHLIDSMVEDSPSRLGRLEVVLAVSDWPLVSRPPQMLEGWRRDVDELMDDHEPSAAQDATILSLLLKVCRLRTAGYEAAYMLARGLDAEHIAGLLSPLWSADRESDDRAAEELSQVVGRGDWEELPDEVSVVPHRLPS